MDRFDTSALEPRTQPGNYPASGESASPIICFSHLRWNFVFQRPQHLMTEALKGRRVFFWEEPIWVDTAETAIQLQLSSPASNLTVVAPLLHEGMDDAASLMAQSALLRRLVVAEGLQNALLWYYTPSALPFSDFLADGRTVVYDAMDELSAFLGADPALPDLERRLLDRADVVFTGGFSLYEAKQNQHANVHPFPSGVDTEHFRPARGVVADPFDQVNIPYPRLGFYGVIDERLDTELLAQMAWLRPDWHIVMVGPVVKIEQASLPRAVNIHYLGGKNYNELPLYLAGWNVALLPFALNRSTRFISPTKTPEYLAGGRPVVSTPITDVIRHYGHVKGVAIAGSANEFVSAVEAFLELGPATGSWMAEADEMLAACSWRGIWSRMSALITQAERRTAGLSYSIGAVRA